MAVHSFDSKLEYADDSGFSTNLVEVAGPISLEGPDRQATRVNSTVLRSTGAIKTSIAGFIDDNTVTATIAYTAAGYALLGVIFLARSTKYWRVTLLDTSKLTGPGFIQGLSGPSVPEDDRLTFTLTISPTAGWTHAAS